ncbi:MAG: hydroxylamine oxidase [Ignavibacteria bacterium]|nr:hydroxylamine oxidase [Ignavibacteria bacterium]
MKLPFRGTLAVLYLLCSSSGFGRQQDAGGSPARMSEETAACVECHKSITPGIVEDWLTSRHARVTPSLASSKAELERRVSSTDIPASLREIGVGCYECHSRNANDHKDNFDHFGYQINVIVSPRDCSTCHALEAMQYSESKKAHALGNLRQNPIYHLLLETITGMKVVDGQNVSRRPASENTKLETCYACHGTHVDALGLRTVSTSVGEIEVPDLTNWPNQGVGRRNPDGSYGACTACHPRHSFSIEIARKPYTCAQCHLEPDVPAWEVYRESKHGNIMLSKQHDQNWDAVPWKVGKDFRTPSCATCHNSLVTNADGEVIVSRSHDFGARLWVRIFGLIYSHPQPKSGATSIIKNKDGLPLPTTFSGVQASEYLIDKEEQQRRQMEMKKVCQSCHSTSWSERHFVKLAQTIAEVDSMVIASTKLMLDGWKRKLANNANPFDEALEQKWVRQWLLYANSIRYGSAMGGPDYATFKNGWYELTRNLEEMRDYLRR